MQSTNPISPARRSSFALALAVTFAPLIMGGEVALAKPQCEPPTGSQCLHALPTNLTKGATFKISNQFATNATLYGQNVPDTDFWVFIKDDGQQNWWFQDTNNCYWQFPPSSNSPCFVQLSAIQDGSIYVTTGAVKSSVVQVVYWPQPLGGQAAPPPGPPAETPFLSSNDLPPANTGSYAAYAEIELSVVPGGASIIDVSLLNRYNFAHQLLYWNSTNCVPPSNPNTPPDIASGFNGNLASADIYTALTEALNVPASNGYFPAQYPDPQLMYLNGSIGNFSNSEYVGGQWIDCHTSSPLQWGLETGYLASGFSYTGHVPGYTGHAPVSSYGNVAQNFPIDTNSGNYSTDNEMCGIWHPSKSSVSKSPTGVGVAQVFGNKYGGESGYLSALHAAMPSGGYFISNSQRISVDPGILNPLTASGPKAGPRFGGSGYSFNLNIAETIYKTEQGLVTDYHLELRDITVFNTPNSGPGKAADPTFLQTHPDGAGEWYPSATCGSPSDFQMQNPPRGRFGVPADPLTCLLVEGAGPNHLPTSTLSDQYDYPYVYTTLMVADASHVYGPKGGPILANASNDPHTLLTDTTDTTSWPTPLVCTNPNGTGRTFTPPGYQALRLYLLDQTDSDNPQGIREYVASQDLSNVACVVAQQPSSPSNPHPTLPMVGQGTLVWQVRLSTSSCAPGLNCPATGLCTNCTAPIKCPLSQDHLAGTSSFCNSYYGPQTWSGAPSKGTGLKPDSDHFSSLGFPGWQGSCAQSNTGGMPFNWRGPFADTSSSIYPVFYLCTNPNGCGCYADGPGGVDAIGDGWVLLTYYPKALQDSKYWTWPPATNALPAPTGSAGVLLQGTFNWFGAPSETAQPAVIKIGSNGYPEPYFDSQPLLQWQSQLPPSSSYASYTPSNISWNQLWTNPAHPDQYFLWSACNMPASGPNCAYGANSPPPPCQAILWGGGKIVPHLGNWTDLFVNTGGAAQGSLVMYSHNYPEPPPPNPPTAPQPPTGLPQYLTRGGVPALRWVLEVKGCSDSIRS